MIDQLSEMLHNGDTMLRWTCCGTCCTLLYYIILLTSQAFLSKLNGPHFWQWPTTTKPLNTYAFHHGLCTWLILQFGGPRIGNNQLTYPVRDFFFAHSATARLNRCVKLTPFPWKKSTLLSNSLTLNDPKWTKKWRMICLSMTTTLQHSSSSYTNHLPNGELTKKGSTARRSALLLSGFFFIPNLSFGSKRK